MSAEDGGQGQHAQDNDKQGQQHSYEDIGLSSEKFQAGVTEIRKYVIAERVRLGAQANDAEIARGMIHRQVEEGMKSGNYDESVVSRYEEHVTDAWDAIAFDRYGKERKTISAFHLVESNKGQEGKLREIVLDRRETAMLDMIASALGIPHEPGQHSVSISPQIEEYRRSIPRVRKAGLEHFPDYPQTRKPDNETDTN